MNQKPSQLRLTLSRAHWLGGARAKLSGGAATARGIGRFMDVLAEAGAAENRAAAPARSQR
jgi:hypothetical protein